MFDYSKEISSLEDKLNKIYLRLIRLKNNPNFNSEKIEELEEDYSILSEIISQLEDL